MIDLKHKLPPSGLGELRYFFINSFCETVYKEQQAREKVKLSKDI